MYVHIYKIPWHRKLNSALTPIYTINKTNQHHNRFSPSIVHPSPHFHKNTDPWYFIKNIEMNEKNKYLYKC